MATTRNGTPKVNPKYAWYRVKVAKSGIHSWGLFAEEDIPRGKAVIEYTGKRMSMGRASLLKPPHDIYLVRASTDVVLDGATRGSGAEFINHSCDPNLEGRRRQGRVIFYSRRRIRAGEELSFRYAYPIEFTKVACRCGSPKCRHTLRYLFR